MSSYPSTSATLRTKLEKISALPDDSPEWARLTREELRMPVWLVPAIQVAVRDRVWEGVRDPFIAIRGAVHKLAIGMRLNSGNQAAVDPDAED